MREIIQCLFCASFGFMTAALLIAGKNHSSEANINNSSKNDMVKEVPTATSLSGIPKGT